MSGRPPVEGRVLTQDLVVQLLQRRARFDAQLGVEHRTQLAVGGERVRLPPSTVEREDALGVEPLAQGVVGDERAGLGHYGLVVPEVELGLDA